MLWRVDSSIVESYYARALQGELPLTPELGSDESLSRLLEVVEIICGEDGESYAHQLKNVLKAMEGDGPLNKRPVLQDAVGETLSRMHSGRLPEQYRTYMLTHDFIGDSTWRGGCIGALFATLTDPECEIGPTLMVILTALLCEYLQLSPVSPLDILRGLGSRVAAYAGKCIHFKSLVL